GAVGRRVAGEYRVGLAPGPPGRGVGTCTGAKAGSTIRPAIGASVVAANDGSASPRRVAACMEGEDRNWTSTRMGFPFPAAVWQHARPSQQTSQPPLAPGACRRAAAPPPGAPG